MIPNRIWSQCLKNALLFFLGILLLSFHFQTAAVVGDQQSAEDRAEGIFNKMDVNSDGKVTRCSSKKTLFYKSNSFVNQSLVKGFQSYPHSFKARVCSMLRQRSEDGRPALPPVQNIAAYQFHKLKYSQIFPNIPENLCKLSFLKYIQIKALIGSSGRNIASRNLPLRERGPEDPDISWSTTRIEIENYSAAFKFEVHNMCITHSNFSIIIYISYIYSIVVLFYINCSKSTFS